MTQTPINVDDPINNEGLDPYHQAQDSFEQEAANFYAAEEAEAIENQELKNQVVEEDKFSDAGDVVRGVAETALQPVLGVGDFASDAIGLVPWL